MLGYLRMEPWPGTLCCVLGQDTLLSQCLSPPMWCFPFYGCKTQANLLSYFFMASSSWVPSLSAIYSPTTPPLHVGFPAYFQVCFSMRNSERFPLVYPQYPWRSCLSPPPSSNIDFPRNNKLRFSGHAMHNHYFITMADVKKKRLRKALKSLRLPCEKYFLP